MGQIARNHYRRQTHRTHIDSIDCCLSIDEVKEIPKSTCQALEGLADDTRSRAQNVVKQMQNTHHTYSPMKP